MKLIFRLRFSTQPGQSLLLTGNHPILGGGKIESAVRLQYLDAEFWQAVIYLAEGAVPDAALAYHYILQNADGSTVQDWGGGCAINPASFQRDEILVIDSWNPAGALENAFYTEPFKKVLLQANHTEVRAVPPLGATHTFKVKAPLLAKGQTLCLTGGCARAGQLDHRRAAPAEPDCRRTIF